ncbi:hypothetical protein EB796_020439 [Bugula neritina]|uniref:Uncharacterized protein n=1 Tax=Bugula neritina TaxID=10212 RepID=A0A7J7J575_BUGNE|nr:hypothetical protein EB796_020439 [Bugula neritina]
MYLTGYCYTKTYILHCNDYYLEALVVVSCYQTALYKSYSLPEFSPNLSQDDSGTAISTLLCVYDCMRREDCASLDYDWKIKRCSVRGCVNPNLYSEGHGDGYDFYIRVDVEERFTKLLAKTILAIVSMLTSQAEAASSCFCKAKSYCKQNPCQMIGACGVANRRCVPVYCGCTYYFVNTLTWQPAEDCPRTCDF